MKSFQSPCSSMHDAPLRPRLAPAEYLAPSAEHQMVPDSSHGLPQRPDAENLGGPHGHLPPLSDPEKSSATTLQRRPPCWAIQKEEAFRSPSSPEEDPPRTSSAEKGRGPTTK